MRRIAHISDLHFFLADPGVVEALAAELNADPPDLVAVSGDLTMRARSREFRAARAFLDGLRAPVLAVPGNHDITSYWLHERLFDPLGRWRRFIAEEPEPVWADGEVAVVGVNTASRAGAFLDWSQGRVGEGRLRRAVERLRALPDGLFRVVVAHHPFLPPESAPDTRLVGRAEAALAAFAANGVRMVLSGHLHLGYMAPAQHLCHEPPFRVRRGRAWRPCLARTGLQHMQAEATDALHEAGAQAGRTGRRVEERHLRHPHLWPPMPCMAGTQGIWRAPGDAPGRRKDTGRVIHYGAVPWTTRKTWHARPPGRRRRPAGKPRISRPPRRERR